MSRENWKCVILVSAVQVVSESVFFSQGILSNERILRKSETNDEEWNWFLICVPLAYLGFRQISEPCWRRVFRGYGNRGTTAIGTIWIAIASLCGFYSGEEIGPRLYAVLGGIGSGLVALQEKSAKFRFGNINEWSIWGIGVTGIGLIIWPLLTSLLEQYLDSKWTNLVLILVTLQAPIINLLVPTENDTRLNSYGFNDAQEQAFANNTKSRENHEGKLGDGNEYRIYERSTYDTRNIRPSYCVEILPGIPEERENESEQEYETRRTEEKKENNIVPRKIERVDSTRMEIIVDEFQYSLFVGKILLRSADQLGQVVVVSFFPAYSSVLRPGIRVQEKAFLVSLCGFSRLCCELSLLVLYHRKSNRRKIILLGGPVAAILGFYVAWNSLSLDAITISTFVLGLATGSAGVALRVLSSPAESPEIGDTSDLLVGTVLLALILLARTFIVERAIRGCFLIVAGFYGASAIAWFYALE